MNTTTQDAPTVEQRPNKPFGKLGLVKRPADQGGGYIGCHSKDGELFAGFAEVDPNGVIWPPTEADEVARALIACWNACAEAGLTVEQLEAGTIKATMEENAGLKTTVLPLLDRVEDLLSDLVPVPDCDCYGDSGPCLDCRENGEIYQENAVITAGIAVTRALLSPATP
jgi:hypothetical protein